MENFFEDRQRTFQKINFEKGENKRQEFVVQLRKNKRISAQNSLRLKKLMETTVEMECGPTDSADEDIEATVFDSSQLSEGLDRLPLMDMLELHASLNYLKEILSAKNGPVADFIRAGVIPKVIPYTSKVYQQEIRFAAFWILCNTTAIDDSFCVNALQEYSLKELFITALDEENDEIVEHPLWGLANMIGDGKDSCKSILSQGFLQKIDRVLKRSTKAEIYSTAAWALSNIFHYESLLDKDMTQEALEICSRILKYPHSQVKRKVLHALYVLVRSENSKIEIFLNNDIFAQSFAYWNDCEFYRELVKLAANICSGNHIQTQKILDTGILDKLWLLIDSEDEELVYDICFLLSNVAAGKVEQVKLLYSHTIFYRALNNLFSSNEKIKIEVSYMLFNFFKAGGENVKKALLNDVFMGQIVKALEFKRPEFVVNLLSVFKEYIKLWGKNEFVEKDYDKVVEAFETHRSEEVFKICEEIHELAY